MKATDTMHLSEVRDWYKYHFPGSSARKKCEMLALLNDCTVGEIVHILEMQGITVTFAPRRPRKGTIIDDDTARRMYENGATDRMVAKAFGVTRNGACAWQLRNGIPVNPVQK